MTCKSHSKKVVQDVKMKENKGSAPIGSLLAVLLLQVLISCVQCQVRKPVLCVVAEPRPSYKYEDPTSC